MNEEKCYFCDKEAKNLSDTTIKINGVVSYYDKDVKICDKCKSNDSKSKYNQHLIETWG